jgi:hypothetical protein
MSPDLAWLRSHEEADEVANLTRAGDLLGETPLFTYFKAPKARSEGLAWSSQGQGSRSAVERRCGPFHTGAGSVDEAVPVLLCWGVLTRRGGSRGPPRRLLRPSGGGEMLRSSCPGRVRESEAWTENALERRKPRRGSAVGPG